MSDDTPGKKSLMYGALLKCPRCGEGRLFKSYLKREDACPRCGESFGGLDADDGPAWLTIGLAAHIIVPLVIMLERGELLPIWLEISVLAAATIACVLALLPVSKGFFIAALWLIARKRA